MTGTAPTLGRYVLVEELDAGGMGAIYVALQQSTLSGVERPCVVKTVQPELIEQAELRSRFLDETKTSLMLMHKNICTTFDVDDANGTILLAMERIAGRNLRQVLDNPPASGGALEPDEIVDIGEELLEGLEHAHSFADPRTGNPLGLVHRDISPKNVMVAFSGDLKIIDFGVARGLLNETRTQAGVVVGKLRYLAPEQFLGARVDARADLVSVGIILAELFSRKRYYGDLSGEAIENVLRQGTPYASAALDSVPRTVRSVLETALARDPDDRFEDAALFREALRSAWGRPKQSGRLKQMMARLFPGAEAADRAHLQSLYRRARGDAPVPVHAPASAPVAAAPPAIARSVTGLCDDATQRSPTAHADSSDVPSDPDRTVLAHFDPNDLVTNPGARSPVRGDVLDGGEAPDTVVSTAPDLKPVDLSIPDSDMSGDSASQRTVLFAKPETNIKNDLPPTDELPRPQLPAQPSIVSALTSDEPNTGTIPNAPPRAPSSTDSGPVRDESLTMPVPRSRAGVHAAPMPNPERAVVTDDGSSALVWVFMGITVVAGLAALLILLLR